MTTINPYQIIGTQHRDTLQRIQDGLHPNMTFDEFNSIISDCSASNKSVLIIG